MKYSITRALAELKLLDSRIQNTTQRFYPCIAKKKRDANATVQQSKVKFVEEQKSILQSINSLIQRRSKIKALIVDSNSKTKVTVCGEEMTVSEAIERKTQVEYEKELLKRLKNIYSKEKDALDRHNSQVEQNLNNLLAQHFGKDTNQKTNPADIESIANPYRVQNEAELVDSINCADEIVRLENKIEDFENEVDYILSESNTITNIEIED